MESVKDWGKANQIVSYSQKGVRNYNVLSLAEPKKSTDIHKYRIFVTNFTQAYLLDQSGHSCSEQFTKCVDVLVVAVNHKKLKN